MTYFARIRPFLALVAAMLLVVPIAHAAPSASSTSDEQTTTTTVTRTTTGEDDSSDAKAAAKRAAASKFEREKLDSKAFADTGNDSGSKESDKPASKSGGAGAIARALFGLAVVVAAIFGVHWLLKKWGANRMQGSAGKAGIIDVVATTNLAQGRSLHLVRVGDEMVLVGATEQSITRIGDVDLQTISSAAGNAGKGEFQAMLTGAMYGQQPGVPEGMGGAGAAKDPFMRRFLDNLRMSTAR